ncbi:thioesterase family protein [Pseudotenacibaculum sp. MALMAid0570]|uniref:acyl-CoA thioesterase n=1 Tax=Pseudotenacibaculum sp. MALMAid0570 TaxID=3143938 RepID=UPI0032DF3D7A
MKIFRDKLTYPVYLNYVCFMSVFEIQITVLKEDIDELNHVNNVVYLHWVQNIANLHWNELKKGHNTSNYVWVVLRHEIDYLAQATIGDRLKVRTWVGKTGGIKSLRHVEFFKDEKLLVKAQTTYCLLDAKTFKPTRITNEILDTLAPK